MISANSEQIIQEWNRVVNGIEEGSEVASLDESVQENDEVARHWRASPFAVGKSKITWADEDVGCRTCCRSCFTGKKSVVLQFSGLICGKLPVGRVGNLIVLKQRTEAVLDDNQQKIGERPRLLCVLGPYWPMMAFITIPGLVLFSFSTCYMHELWNSTWQFVILLAVNTIAIVSLLMTACSDPGVLYRHAELPPGHTAESTIWIWSDQALTYRPPNARFDPETGVVVADFDHTCPWTGTAIGENNILWFRFFVPFAFISLITNMVILVWPD
ncbi:hypothetical protein FisN_3Hh161 [Fistulifera solaris]|uniref:Palmitoyltransferase n=1 Tax=Fistulifera solaris TaxID=1519565 RepID=A0A1Z5JNV0_FISSO|nr:hypothetical protein FisN_3Hh161 [Fistulifera solaris]|eukprot:GAX15687.1 hypothetical protein FisN_3Hh161 [Fistulifera solaris]